MTCDHFSWLCGIEMQLLLFRRALGAAAGPCSGAVFQTDLFIENHFLTEMFHTGRERSLPKTHVPSSHSRAEEAQAQADEAAEQWERRQGYTRPKNIPVSVSTGPVFLLPPSSCAGSPSAAGGEGPALTKGGSATARLQMETPVLWARRSPRSLPKVFAFPRLKPGVLLCNRRAKNGPIS